MARQPFGQCFQFQGAPRLALIRQLGIRDQHQWMQFHGAAARAYAHAHLLGVISQQITIDDQRGQQIVQFQPAATAKQGCDLR
jgi:hypothetical protein